MPPLSLVMRWALGSCLALNMLSVGATVGKAKLTAAAAELCNAPLGATLLQANDLKLPAEAIWQNRSEIFVPGIKSQDATKWFLTSSMHGTLRIQMGQELTGADTSIALTIKGPQLLEVAGLTEAALKKLHTTQTALVQVDAQGRVLKATRLQAAKALDDLFGNAAVKHTLGAQFATSKIWKANSQASFALWAPTARAVSVCIYPDAQAPAVGYAKLKRDNASGVWQSVKALAKQGSYYRFAVEVFVPGVGWVINHVNDPYAVSLSANSLRSYVADLNAPKLKPAGWDKHRAPQTVKHPTDMVIYELHVRDFSINDRSVPTELRGKYLAFTQNSSQGMKHLQELAKAGMTDLHLLPVFDLATVPEKNCQSDPRSDQTTRANDCFNWGYDPLHFNAPEGSYATDAEDGAKRILEFRRMVKALHEAGWRVGMDMVYNHTSASGQHVQSVLDRIVPGYYHRLNAKGEVERSTCCDNTATENRMMAKLMSDSILLWTQHYKLDSYRFDLMGHQPKDVMLAMQNRLQKTLKKRVDFVGEGWNFGEVANGARFVQASQLSLNGTGIGTFNDRLRDAIRGGGAGDSVENLIKMPGFVSGRESSERVSEQIRAGLAGSLRNYRMATADGKVKALQDIPYGDQPTGYVSQPSEVVNYAENHDNLTLFDSLAYKLPRETTSAERARVQMLAGALVAFSQGVTYFHAGQEILRSKSLDVNSYDSGDLFNVLDWSYQSNHFGEAIPDFQGSPEANAISRALLKDSQLKPSAADILWTRNAHLDLLKIRKSSKLFRLETAQDVEVRLRFLSTDLQADPRLIAGHLQGHDLNDFAELIYFVNVSEAPQSLEIPQLAQKAFELHPVQASLQAADARPRESAKYLKATGTFEIPARSAVVFVVKGSKQ